jgi:hypothetical protein
VFTVALIRLNRHYQAETDQLERGAVEASEMPVLRRHVVLVLVDRLDLATARALQYARSLDPDEVRAVHFLLDNQAAQVLRDSWERLMIRRLPLEIRECRDRRLGRAALELVSATLADGETEVSVLLPRRLYSWGWGHLLHDRTADRLAAILGRLPHANATVVPFQLGKPKLARVPEQPPRKPRKARPQGKTGKTRADWAQRRRAKDQDWDESVMPVEGALPVGDIQWRQRGRIAGRITSVEVQPWRGAQVLSCTLTDRTGSMTLVFTRRDVPGVETGAQLIAEGTVGEHEGRLAMLNPLHEILKRAPTDPMR